MGVPIQGEMGHKWRLDEDGEIDRFGLEYDYHNGPICEICDYAYCWHCGPPRIDCVAPEKKDPT